MLKTLKFTTVFGALSCVPSLVFAHTEIDSASGFFHGFVHPVLGFDHVIAMVLVGLYAFQVGGRAKWLVPATFVVLMSVGGLLGHMGVQVPFVEAGIAVSVLATGVAVAFAIGPPTALVAAVAGLFAVFHGYAHGAEMPDTVRGMTYALGFMVTTALLHGVGAVFGASARKTSAIGRGVRSVGALAACAGMAILSGLI